MRGAYFFGIDNTKRQNEKYTKNRKKITDGFFDDVFSNGLKHAF